MDRDAIKAVANAILYEGYMLYPYRPSALKNRSQGWSFGTLLPEAYAAAHPGEASEFRAEVPANGAHARLTAEIRFLQLAGESGATNEACERSVCMKEVRLEDLQARPLDVPFSFPLPGEACREGCSVSGVVKVSAEKTHPADKIRVSVHNRSSQAISWETRDSALRQALVSTHALLTLEGGEFVSLLDPPEALRAAAASCEQKGVFPVLAGEEGQRTAMLLSPIILYDYPKIAPGSDGDFFDSSEIDEMLTLRVLTLTDDEKNEMRAAGERARAILERTEALSPEEILKLHGVTRVVPGGK